GSNLPEIVRLLVDAVPSAHRLEFINDQGCAPLLTALAACFFAEEYGDKRIEKIGEQVVKFLIENGASVNASLDRVQVLRIEDLGGNEPENIQPGTKPMEYAVEKGYDWIIKLLGEAKNSKKRKVDDFS